MLQLQSIFWGAHLDLYFIEHKITVFDDYGGWSILILMITVDEAMSDSMIRVSTPPSNLRGNRMELPRALTVLP